MLRMICVSGSIFLFGVLAHAAYTSEAGWLKMDKVEYELAKLEKSCPELYLDVKHGTGRVALKSFKRLAEVGGKSYFYQLCRGVDLAPGVAKVKSPMDNTQAFLWESTAKPGVLKVVWAEAVEIFGGQWFEPARTVKHGKGQILILPNPTGGNAGYGNDRYFFAEGSSLVRLESEKWKEEVRAKLPKGLTLWNDLKPDLVKMKFASPVWKDKVDSHASPTGGRVEGTLAVEGTKLVLKSVKFQ